MKPFKGRFYMFVVPNLYLMEPLMQLHPPFIPSKNAKNTSEEETEGSPTPSRTEDDPYDSGKTVEGDDGEHEPDAQGPPLEGEGEQVCPPSPMEDDLPPPGQDDPIMEGSPTPTEPFDPPSQVRWPPSSPAGLAAEPVPPPQVRAADCRLLCEMGTRFNKLESPFEKVASQIGANPNECFKKVDDVEKRCIACEKALEKKTEGQCSSLSAQLRSMSARVEKLEKDAPASQPAAAPPPRASSLPRGPQEPDPWSTFLDNRAAQRPAVQPIVRAPAIGKFAPKRVLLKGRSRPEENNGAGRDEAKAFA